MRRTVNIMSFSLRNFIPVFVSCSLSAQSTSPNTFIPKDPDSNYSPTQQKKCFKRIQSKIMTCLVNLYILIFRILDARLGDQPKRREFITALLHQPITAAPGKPAARTKSNYIPRVVKQSFVFCLACCSFCSKKDWRHISLHGDPYDTLFARRSLHRSMKQLNRTPE